jgi:hypothetical protein
MKLRITVDIFSGRPNPSWVLEDADQVAELLERFEAAPAAFTEPGSVPSKLGLRAVRVERLSDHPDDAAQAPSLPDLLIVAPATRADTAAAAQLAEDLVKTAPASHPLATADAPQQLTQELQDHIIGEIRRWPTAPGGEQQRSSGSGPGPIAPGAGGLGDIVCPYDTAAFAPGDWNDPVHILRNNCYNYASNLRNDTFAQPGHAHGYTIPVTCTGPDVATGALRDGYRADGTCQPATATNRWVVAMVTGTFPDGTRDFHWYRRQTEGFWGHKPGESAAVNLDNSGRVITDPETCDRGFYTEWNGYYLSSNLVTIS